MDIRWRKTGIHERGMVQATQHYGVTEPLASFDPFRGGAVDHDVRGERRSVHRYSFRIRGRLRVRKVLPGALRGDGTNLYAMETESGKKKNEE